MSENLEAFLRIISQEAGALEAAYCAASCSSPSIAEWFALERRTRARKLARESRDGFGGHGPAIPAPGRQRLRTANC